MARMIEFIQVEFLPCFSIGFIAGAVIAGTIAGIRAVVRVAKKAIR